MGSCLRMSYPLGSYCYSGKSVTATSPRATEETASEWWDAAHEQDQRHHDWIMKAEAQAQERLERQILARNNKMLPGDYAMSRLGETAYAKGLAAHSVAVEAREQDIELRAESHRSARERIANWNYYGAGDRHD